jgi:hypothetical protein
LDSNNRQMAWEEKQNVGSIGGDSVDPDLPPENYTIG